MSVSWFLYIPDKSISRVIKRELIALPVLSTSESIIKSNRNYEERIWIPMFVLGKDLWSCEDISREVRSIFPLVQQGWNCWRIRHRTVQGVSPFRVAYVCVTATRSSTLLWFLLAGTSHQPALIFITCLNCVNTYLLFLSTMIKLRKLQE